MKSLLKPLRKGTATLKYLEGADLTPANQVKRGRRFIVLTLSVREMAGLMSVRNPREKVTSVRGKSVHEKIRATLMKESHNTLFLNNGARALADGIMFDVANKTVHVENLDVVNGKQTQSIIEEVMADPSVNLNEANIQLSISILEDADLAERAAISLNTQIPLKNITVLGTTGHMDRFEKILERDYKLANPNGTQTKFIEMSETDIDVEEANRVALQLAADNVIQISTGNPNAVAPPVQGNDLYSGQRMVQAIFAATDLLTLTSGAFANVVDARKLAPVRIYGNVGTLMNIFEEMSQEALVNPNADAELNVLAERAVAWYRLYKKIDAMGQGSAKKDGTFGEHVWHLQNTLFSKVTVKGKVKKSVPRHRRLQLGFIFPALWGANRFIVQNGQGMVYDTTLLDDATNQDVIAFRDLLERSSKVKSVNATALINANTVARDFQSPVWKLDLLAAKI